MSNNMNKKLHYVMSEHDPQAMKELADKPLNPCNDCKVESPHCPLYPKACKRFDEYCKAINKEAK